MSKSIYNIDYKKLVLLLLPTFLRKPLITAFANAMTLPLMTINSDFNDYRKITDYRLYHNGQICYLRAVLNDQFDPILRRITIDDADNNTKPLLIYWREVNIFQMVPLRASGNAIIINRSGFSGAGGYDFIINIPVLIKNDIDENRLRAITNTYKLASKRYAINYN